MKTIKQIQEMIELNLYLNDILEDIIAKQKEIQIHLDYKEKFNDLFPELADRGVKKIKVLDQEIKDLKKRYNEIQTKTSIINKK
jgi:hypothetical protein